MSDAPSALDTVRRPIYISLCSSEPDDDATEKSNKFSSVYDPSNRWSTPEVHSGPSSCSEEEEEEEDDDDDDDNDVCSEDEAQLAQLRFESVQKLRSAWEGVIARYGKVQSQASADRTPWSRSPPLPHPGTVQREAGRNWREEPEEQDGQDVFEHVPAETPGGEGRLARMAREMRGADERLDEDEGDVIDFSRPDWELSLCDRQRVSQPQGSQVAATAPDTQLSSHDLRSSLWLPPWEDAASTAGHTIGQQKCTPDGRSADSRTGTIPSAQQSLRCDEGRELSPNKCAHASVNRRSMETIRPPSSTLSGVPTDGGLSDKVPPSMLLSAGSFRRLQDFPADEIAAIASSLAVLLKTQRGLMAGNQTLKNRAIASHHSGSRPGWKQGGSIPDAGVTGFIPRTPTCGSLNNSAPCPNGSSRAAMGSSKGESSTRASNSSAQVLRKELSSPLQTTQRSSSVVSSRTASPGAHMDPACSSSATSANSGTESPASSYDAWSETGNDSSDESVIAPSKRETLLPDVKSNVTLANTVSAPQSRLALTRHDPSECSAERIRDAVMSKTFEGNALNDQQGSSIAKQPDKRRTDASSSYTRSESLLLNDERRKRNVITSESNSRALGELHQNITSAAESREATQKKSMLQDGRSQPTKAPRYPSPCDNLQATEGKPTLGKRARQELHDLVDVNSSSQRLTSDGNAQRRIDQACPPHSVTQELRKSHGARKQRQMTHFMPVVKNVPRPPPSDSEGSRSPALCHGPGSCTKSLCLMCGGISSQSNAFRHSTARNRRIAGSQR